MQPSVGRIVHYKPTADENADHLAAIITKVWSPDMVNLEVFGLPVGSERVKTSVSRVDADGAAMGWHWPERVEE